MHPLKVPITPIPEHKLKILTLISDLESIIKTDRELTARIAAVERRLGVTDIPILIDRVNNALYNDMTHAVRLTALEETVKHSRAQDLSQKLDSNTRRLDDLQATAAKLAAQVEELETQLQTNGG